MVLLWWCRGLLLPLLPRAAEVWIAAVLRVQVVQPLIPDPGVLFGGGVQCSGGEVACRWALCFTPVVLQGW